MSDHDSEVSPEVESMNGSFSTNGYDTGAIASAFDVGGSGQDLSFLDDLAKAMRTTAAAQQARDAELTDQRRQAHLDAIRAREALEAEDLRELAKEDVKGIDAWSDGEIKRIKLERERRIASRREQLQVRLEEHRMVIASEVEAVEAALASYRIETERFFDRLGSQTDPVEIARQAGTRPPFPDLDRIGPEPAPAIAAYTAPVYDAPVATPPSAEPDVIEPAQVIEATDAVEVVEASEASEPVAVAEAPETIEVPETVETIEPTESPQPIEAVAAVEVIEAVDTAEAAEPVVETVVAEAEQHVVDGGAPADTSELIGVMDPATSQAATESPWESGVEPVAEPASVAESVETTAQAADAIPDSPAASDGEEPVAVGAEARVVMPRTTGGAGSWLRWPNSSIDRSDPSR